MGTIKFSKKYKQLFDLLKGKHPEVDTVIITGGRGSAKSFVCAVFALTALVYHLWNVLYTRFTNVSIIDSIKPEVDGKIELLQLENFVTSTNTHIERDGNRIAFKGIKTGSKQQTANLKSLFGFNCFIIDEAEETPDYETYEKVFLSIRSKDRRNVTILILNPASVHHWIYREFFLGRNVDGGSNCVKGNVMYIHTSYLDVAREYLADNIVSYYQHLKEKDPDKYEQVVMGGWTEAVEGRVFNNWKRNTFAEFLLLPFKSFYGVDWGKNHKFGIVELKYDPYKNILYCHERNYLSENELIAKMTIEQINVMNNEGGIVPHTIRSLGIPTDAYLVCDSAVPDNIMALRYAGWEYAFGIDKPKGSVMAGITLLHSTTVIYTEESKGIDLEFKTYAYANDRLGVVDDEVIKAFDDLIDPIRYGRRFAEKHFNGK
jgi:phage terminase large subunit